MTRQWWLVSADSLNDGNLAPRSGERSLRVGRSERSKILTEFLIHVGAQENSVSAGPPRPPPFFNKIDHFLGQTYRYKCGRTAHCQDV